MGWTKGIRCVGGLFAGQVFPGNGDLPDTYDVAPHFTPANTLNYYRGEGGAFEGFNILNLFINMNEGNRQLLYVIDIDPAPSSAFVKAELRGFVEKNGSGLTYFIVVREYTDATTYTDRDIRESSVTIGSFFPAGSSQYVETKYIYLHFVYTSYNGVSAVCTGMTWRDDDWLGNITYREAGYMQDYPNFVSIITGTVPEEEYSPEFGPAAEPEGYDGGSFDYHSDVIDMPSKPQSVLSLGFVNVYKCAPNSLVDFGAELFPEIQWPTSLSDVGEVLAAFSDSVWNSKLIDYVVSVHCVPGNVDASPTLVDIKVGARTMTGIMGRKITDEYYDFDFGTLHTDAIYKNFVDQMCQAELYLPFYGFISLKPEHWNGGDLSVKYRINVIDGSFTAFVFSKPAKSEMTQAGLIGQYGGSCVVHLPVSSMSYASMFSGMVGGATQAALGVASGTMTTAVSGAMTVSGAVGGGMTGGDSKMSNSYNASSSFMTRRRPFLLVSAPIPSFSTRYNIEQGLPTNQAMVLGSCSGFVKASNAILDGIPCTDAERNKIKAALASGLIF